MLNTGAIAITNEAGATLEGKSGGILEIDSNVTNVNATTSKIVADDGGTVELVNNTITGGAIALNGATTPTMLQIEGTVTLTGGTVTLSDYSGNSIVSTHDEVAGAATLINKDTLSGAGTIGDGSGGINLSLDNFGTVDATGTNPLIINTGSNPITNETTGILEASAGSTLEIKSNVTNVNATTSTIIALDGGTVELVNDTVTGGTINLDSAGAATKLEIAGSVTLTGGTVTLTNNGNNSIVSNGAAATLTNKDSISGAGTIGDGAGGFLTLDNFGDIAAAFTTELVLNTGAIAITNEAGATLEGKSGGILEIDSNVTNVNATTSKIVADDGGTVELVNNTITGGAIALNGATTPTMLQIEGTVTLTGGTVTLSDYSGNSIVSTHDEVAGAATLINKDTLSGAGTIGDGSGGINLSLDNFGTVDATGTNPLIINTGSNPITNETTGILEASAGSTLEIKSNVTNVNATTSTIIALDGGTVELVNDTVTGGTINLELGRRRHQAGDRRQRHADRRHRDADQQWQ